MLRRNAPNTALDYRRCFHKVAAVSPPTDHRVDQSAVVLFTAALFPALIICHYRSTAEENGLSAIYRVASNAVYAHAPSHP
jgi:hypothetical protein